MPNKIQEELKKIAQEIIATKGSVDFEKIYYQTLSLFEKLVVLKNAEVAKKETWKDMESNYNKAIDFIELKKEPVKVLGQNREEILPLMETIKEIVAEFPKVDLKQTETQELQKHPPIKNLNDHFSKGLQIDLNDRLAFIKHLFETNIQEYQRVVSQIVTFSNWEEAQSFVIQIVKPDYNNWEGKEIYEARFFKIIENNFT
ncbi:MAG: hypothetical protein ACKVKK_02790 [Flavobacteriales bacterium]|jgi:hypothetical protein|tara:strand:- start:191 stop:793 length:603 start_codon:yes stop_codon:yes gene_type:complete